MKKDKETKLTEEELNSLMRELQNIKTEDFADRAKIKERSDLLEQRDEEDLGSLMARGGNIKSKKGGGFTYKMGGTTRTMSENMKEMLGGREYLESNFQGGGSISDIFLTNLNPMTAPMQQPMQQPMTQRRERGGPPKRNPYQWEGLVGSGGGGMDWMSLLSNLGGGEGGGEGGMDWMSLLKNINLGGGQGGGQGGLGGFSGFGGMSTTPPGPHSILPYLSSWQGLSRYQSSPPNKDCIPRAGGGWDCPKGTKAKSPIINWDETVQKSPQSPFGRLFAERGGHIYQTRGDVGPKGKPVSPNPQDYPGDVEGYQAARTAYYEALNEWEQIQKSGGEPVKPRRKDFQGSSQYNRALQQYYKDLDAYNDTIPTPVDIAVTDTTNVPIIEEEEIETGKRPIDKIFRPSSKTQLQRFTKADYEKAKKILADHPEAKTREEKIRVLKDNGLTDDKVRNLYEYAITRGDDIFESSIVLDETVITEPSVAKERAAELYTVGVNDLVKQGDGSYLPKEGAISTSPDRAIWKGDQWTDNPDYMDTATTESVPLPPQEEGKFPKELLRKPTIPMEGSDVTVPRVTPPQEEECPEGYVVRIENGVRRCVPYAERAGAYNVAPIDPIQIQPIPQTISNPPSGPNLPYMPGPEPKGPSGDDKMFEAAVRLGLLDPDPNTWTPENVQAAEDAMEYHDAPGKFSRFFGDETEEGWALKPPPPQPMDPNAYGGIGTNIKGWGPLGVTLAQGIDTDEINYFKDIEEEGIADMTKGIDVYDKGKEGARRMIDRTRRQGIMSLDNYVQSAQQRRAGQRAYDVMAMEQTPLSDLRFDMAKSDLWKDIGGTRFKGDIYDATGATARDERLDKNRDAYHTALAENLTNLGTSMENRAAVLNQQKRNVLLDEFYRTQIDPTREPRATGTCTPSNDSTAANCTDRACCTSKGGTWVE